MPRADDASRSEKKGDAAAKPTQPGPAARAKLVRDSFTMPRQEYRAIEALKARCETLTHSRPKKSELLRAGLIMIARLADDELKRLIADVPALKTGRPAGKAGKAAKAAKAKRNESAGTVAAPGADSAGRNEAEPAGSVKTPPTSRTRRKAGSAPPSRRA